MPESPESDLNKIYKSSEQIIESSGALKNKEGILNIKKEVEEIAFGLKALKVTFARDENKGDTEDIEQKLKEIEEVKDVEVVGVDRSLG